MAIKVADQMLNDPQNNVNEVLKKHLGYEKGIKGFFTDPWNLLFFGNPLLLGGRMLYGTNGEKVIYKNQKAPAHGTGNDEAKHHCQAAGHHQADGAGKHAERGTTQESSGNHRLPGRDPETHRGKQKQQDGLTKDGKEDIDTRRARNPPRDEDAGRRLGATRERQ